MTYQNSKLTAATPNWYLNDVEIWAERTGQSYDAVCELKKIPARLGMTDDDMGFISADLIHFDHVVAPTSYGPVSKSEDLETARKRGNSRVRALLNRFHEDHGAVAPKSGREHWTALIEMVEEREGFVDQGALFSTGKSRSLTVLRARCSMAPQDLTQAELDRVFAEATSETRKSIRKAIKLLNNLIRMHNQIPGLGGVLLAAKFDVPKSPDRAERIRWESLPEKLRTEAEAAFNDALALPEDAAALVRARLDAGEDEESVLADINAMIKERRKRPENRKSAIAGYKSGVTWLWRTSSQRGAGDADSVSLDALYLRENFEAACTDQVARSIASLTLKDPEKSQTLRNRLVSLRTVARHGMKRTDLVARIDLMMIAYHDYIVTPTQMTEEADHTCRMLRDNPHLAARFVQSSETLAEKAHQEIAQARVDGDPGAEDRALRLYESAVMHALQLSRPMRTSNLIRLRHKRTTTAPKNIVWIKKKKHAEITFQPGEIKNDQLITIHVVDGDAEVLWEWMNVHRPRFLELRKIPDSPYVFPGEAHPRLEKDAVSLPSGCVSPATMAETWGLGASILGLGISPHQCRHAIATLILAIEPGNFAKAASVLGDTEDTVRRHYGKDSGAAAAVSVRQSLLAQHPNLFKKMKGKYN